MQHFSEKDQSKSVLTGLELFKKLDSLLDEDGFPVLELSISSIPILEGLVEPLSMPPLPDTWINGSEANAGGVSLESTAETEIGWFPNNFFSLPVYKGENLGHYVTCVPQ